MQGCAENLIKKYLCILYSTFSCFILLVKKIIKKKSIEIIFAVKRENAKSKLL